MKAAKQFNVGIILPDQEPLTHYPIKNNETSVLNEHARSRIMTINTTYAPMIREHYEVAPNIPVTLHFSGGFNSIPHISGMYDFDEAIHAYAAISKDGKIQFSKPVPYCDYNIRWFWLDENHNPKPVQSVCVMAYMLDFKEQYLSDPRGAEVLPDKTAPDYKEKMRAKMFYGEEFNHKQGDKFRDSIRGYYGIHPDTKIMFATSDVLPGCYANDHYSILGDIFVIINGDAISYGPVLGLYHNRDDIKYEEWWKAKKDAE